MQLYGLIGFPLEHSFSPEYFNQKFEREKIRNSEYQLFPLQQINQILDLKRNQPFLKGLNVTAPYKESVISYLDELDPVSQKINAVNTIKCLANGKWIGYNTDVWGFGKSIIKLLDIKPMNALILGKGGASKAIQFVLSKLEIPFQLVSREKLTNTITYSDLNVNVMDNHHLIINCTPLGTFPNIDDAPAMPFNLITDKHFIFDLVYNPSETKLMKEAKQRGAKTMNGEDMLKEQAEESWRIWNE